MRPVHRSLLALAIVLILMSLITAGCSQTGEQASGRHNFEMASLAEMPVDVQNAPLSVRQAYQFAAANHEILDRIPCYCGCGGMGHDSNYACYVSSVGADGQITFDSHALGCSICVDITLDTMRMLDQGKGVEEIKAYVDAQYSRFGPSNIP